MPYLLRNKAAGDQVWLADPNEVEVYVSHGAHGDAWKGHRTRLLAQTTSKEHLAQIGRKTMKLEKCHDTNGIHF